MTEPWRDPDTVEAQRVRWMITIWAGVIALAAVILGGAAIFFIGRAML